MRGVIGGVTSAQADAITSQLCCGEQSVAVIGATFRQALFGEGLELLDAREKSRNHGHKPPRIVFNSTHCSDLTNQYAIPRRIAVTTVADFVIRHHRKLEGR